MLHVKCKTVSVLVLSLLLKPTAVSLQERQRRYLSLSPWDKATLSLVHLTHTHLTVCYLRVSSSCFVSQGRVILSNKMARTVAFFYTLFLHCLVFLVCDPSPPPLREDRGSLWSASVKPISTTYCDFFFFFQVLYKTAWSESIGRDCTAFCAKK